MYVQNHLICKILQQVFPSQPIISNFVRIMDKKVILYIVMNAKVNMFLMLQKLNVLMDQWDASLQAVVLFVQFVMRRDIWSMENVKLRLFHFAKFLKIKLTHKKRDANNVRRIII